MRLLVVGIDPGTTLGYATLDIDGNLVKLKSSKALELNSLIAEITKQGKVLVVGCDKAKIPSFVEHFATKVGAQLINPPEDMFIKQKKKLTKRFDAGNCHERDALSSAIYAHKRYKSLLKKIETFSKRQKKERIKNKIIEEVIKKRKNINKIAEDIEKRNFIP